MFGGIYPGGPEWVREQIRLVRPRANGRWGVGFITWWIPRFEANFQTCLDEHVPIIAFSFGDPSQYVARAKAAGAKVLCQVQTIESARVALGAGADVLVAQGNEAGGHTGQLGTLPLPRAGSGDGREYPGDRVRGDRQWPSPGRGARRRGRRRLDRHAAAGHARGDRGIGDLQEVHRRERWAGHRLHQGVRHHVRPAVPRWNCRSRAESTGSRGSGTGARRRCASGARNWPRWRPSGHLVERDPDVHPIWMGQSAGSVHGVRSVAEVIGELCDGAERLLRERSRTLVG